MPRIRVEEYEHNAAFDLTKEQQENLLHHFETLEAMYQHRMRLGASVQDARRELAEAYKLVHALGIEIAYSWPGYRGKWFFPTYDDAIAYEDWLFQCMD